MITFVGFLSGRTILLTGGALTISVPLAFDASDLPEGLTISGGGVSRVFYMNGADGVFFNGFEIFRGFTKPSDPVPPAGSNRMKRN